MHTLNNHIKKAHTQEVTKVQCPDCGNLFSSGAALRKHASLHKPPELPCPICGKLFHNQTYLMRHANSVHADAEDKKFKVLKIIYLNIFLTLCFTLHVYSYLYK